MGRGRDERRVVAMAALIVAVIGLLITTGCRSATPEAVGQAPPVALEAAVTVAPTRQPDAVVTLTTPATMPVATPAPASTPTIEPTPFFTGALSPSCGQLLPAVPPNILPAQTALTITDASRANLQQNVPAAAWPAVARLLDAPGTVGLAAYQLGQPENSVFLNDASPMPLASVVKLITLVAYAEAVAAGELNPQEPVTLSDLDRFYLPRFDLGAHQRAINDLRTDGRVTPGANPSIALEDVAWIMIRHSSNAASDYLHQRLGQARIEQTALDLQLPSQTAPCPFIGQFLLMGNHTRGQAPDLPAIRNYVEADPSGYAADVSLLTDAYSNSDRFRQAEVDWRQQTRRPSTDAQRTFSENLNAQASAGDYAALMARLAQNGLSTSESSFVARRILEWPNQFPANQELYSNIGYKNGSLPGVLTTAYYAYRWNDPAPVVVVLFFRDLPQQTYRQWRRDLTHDEFARWLLGNPEAMPLLRAALES